MVREEIVGRTAETGKTARLVQREYQVPLERMRNQERQASQGFQVILVRATQLHQAKGAVLCCVLFLQRITHLCLKFSRLDRLALEVVRQPRLHGSLP